MTHITIREPYLNSEVTKLSLLGFHPLTPNTNREDLLDQSVTVQTIDIEKEDVYLAPIRNSQKSEPLEIDLSRSILNPVEQEKLRSLITKYMCIFARNSSDLGYTDIVQHTIPLKEGSVPIRARPYPIADSLKPVLKKQIAELLESGVITQSSAPSFVSPLLFVKKKDGGHRLCIDYCRLNENTVKSHQLLPTIPDVANILAHKRYFTSLDLAAGYWQIAMDTASQDLTTFITPDLADFINE